MKTRQQNEQFNGKYTEIVGDASCQVSTLQAWEDV
jgi:hypothetical protein